MEKWKSHTLPVGICIVTILEANLAKYKAKNVHILTTKIFHFLEYTLERLAAKQVGGENNAHCKIVSTSKTGNNLIFFSSKTKELCYSHQ